MTPIYLANKLITESSGGCRSAFSGVHITHNDSGHAPVLFFFNAAGDDLGAWTLNCKTIDAEDISSAVVRGTPTIALADVGDNTLTRKSCQIFIIDENTIGKGYPITPRVINFAWPDCAHNCEAMALCSDGTILLITKNYPSGATIVFQLRSWLSGDSVSAVYRIAALPTKLGTVTSADISPDESRIVLLANGKAHEYARSTTGTASFKFGISPRDIVMPKSLQPEAVWYDETGTKLLMTSEDKTNGCPLYVVAR